MFSGMAPLFTNLRAPFEVKSDHKSLKWLKTQDVATLSDRLLRWLEYFSLFDFDQGYIPGVDNVLPDHLSRPATLLILNTTQPTPQPLDFMSLVLLVQEHQHICPVLENSADAVLSDTEVHSLFYDQIVAAQLNDPDIQTVVAKLQDPSQAASSEFRTIYVVQDGLLGVREATDRFRTLVPDGPLHKTICRFFHDEAGHPGVQRTLQAVARYFYWPNMDTPAYWSGLNGSLNWWCWYLCPIRLLPLLLLKSPRRLWIMSSVGSGCLHLFCLIAVLNFGRQFGMPSGHCWAQLSSIALRIPHIVMVMWNDRIVSSMKCSVQCFSLSSLISYLAGTNTSS